MRLLLVEDSTRLSSYLARGFRKAGIAVDVAVDGERGLQLAREDNYDVLVLDVMLPKRDGLSVLAELRSSGSTAHVLLLTARDTVEDRVRGLHAGADDYLVKPFAFEELLARVTTQTVAQPRCRGEFHTGRPGAIVVPLLAALVFFGGLGLRFHGEVYPIAPWSMFAEVPNKGIFYSILVHEINGEPLKVPRLVTDLPQYAPSFGTARNAAQLV